VVNVTLSVQATGSTGKKCGMLGLELLIPFGLFFLRRKRRSVR
jgi:hypothetical protein